MKHFHPALLMILQVTGFYWDLVQNFLYSSSNFCIHIEEANRTFFLAESSKNWIKLLDLSQSDCERFWSHWSLLCQIVHLIILILPAKNTLQSGILNCFFFYVFCPSFVCKTVIRLAESSYCSYHWRLAVSLEGRSVIAWDHSQWEGRFLHLVLLLKFLLSRDTFLDSSSSVLEHGSYNESGQRASVKTPFGEVLKEHLWSRRAGSNQLWALPGKGRARCCTSGTGLARLVVLGTWLWATCQVTCHGEHYVSLQVAEQPTKQWLLFLQTASSWEWNSMSAGNYTYPVLWHTSASCQLSLGWVDGGRVAQSEGAVGVWWQGVSLMFPCSPQTLQPASWESRTWRSTPSCFRISLFLSRNSSCLEQV